MNNIEIYTSATCPYCMKAKKLLSMLNLEYTEYNIDSDFEELQKIIKDRFNLSVETVPQIIVNNHYVGGFTDLEAAYKSNSLQALLD